MPIDNMLNQSRQSLAASITKAASKQTYYTVRFLVDRELILDAYRAYGYFRWVDDQLDQGGMERHERIAFVARQRSLIDRCYQGERLPDLADEENMVADLIRGDLEKNSGLHSYIYNMMAVMAFDAERRGRLISHDELTGYTRHLATAVTDALHFFIGHACPPPRSEARYLAATAAHVTHMLRDTLEDIESGYFNIPHEYLEAHGIDPCNVWNAPYRKWIQNRVELARAYFKAGKGYLAQTKNLRCRIAGCAYIARFAGVLDAIERDGFRLRSEYSEGKSVGAGVKMIGSVFSLSFNPRRLGNISPASPAG